jgi:hypothetical protein
VTEYDRLIQCLSRFPSKKWLNHYFNLVKKLLTELSIERNDPRLALTLTKDGKLPVNIGQRYVLRPFRTNRIEIIVPADFEVKTVNGKIVYEFTANRIVDARLIVIPFHENTQLPEIVHNACIEACFMILGKTSKSGFRKQHVPLLYDFTMEPAVRNEILSEVTIVNAAGK